ncbi:hypothetical protein GCM10010446_45370 [Streptomyces enissocaesilis]|uniref:Uncharacterized protein n=1 Tax=Streptomyces enissocaesilis TaxID=332589 RepID=A0ABN3XGC3_9ACTN
MGWAASSRPPHAPPTAVRARPRRRPAPFTGPRTKGVPPGRLSLARLAAGRSVRAAGGPPARPDAGPKGVPFGHDGTVRRAPRAHGRHPYDEATAHRRPHH